MTDKDLKTYNEARNNMVKKGKMLTPEYMAKLRTEIPSYIVNSKGGFEA